MSKPDLRKKYKVNARVNIFLKAVDPTDARMQAFELMKIIETIVKINYKLINVKEQ